uniref:C-type lectin domain-containing protein n=1 Tax=Nothobranchius rachovii TaxID=451742 RepID=A0A1A8QEU7_9TELE
MATAVQREPAGISVDYVNEPDASSRSHSGKGTEACPGLKLVRVVAVSFGLLCILQVTLNVCLRVFVYPPAENKLKELTDQYFKQGWVYLYPGLYYVSSTSNTWHESRKDCQQRQADLVIINTKEEQDFTRKFNRFIWIGLFNNTKTRRWTWVDGTPLTKSYWGPEEPNNLENNSEQCVESRFFNQDNSWNDIGCTNKNFWICEKNLAL